MGPLTSEVPPLILLQRAYRVPRLPARRAAPLAPVPTLTRSTWVVSSGHDAAPNLRPRIRVRRVYRRATVGWGRFLHQPLSTSSQHDTTSARPPLPGEMRTKIAIRLHGWGKLPPRWRSRATALSILQPIYNTPPPGNPDRSAGAALCGAEDWLRSHLGQPDAP